MDSSLAGRIAWITGGGSGMGLACAHELAQAGATVIVSGRRKQALDDAVSAIRAREGDAHSRELDVADASAVALAARTILDGHGKIDILVNAAGINVPSRHWDDLALETWDEIVRTNLNGAFYAVKAVLPQMRTLRSGTIVNVSSWGGVFDLYVTGPAYSASKRGMIAMSNSINIEQGMHGIRSCVICPAEVATPILRARPQPPSEEDLARMLQPLDIARTVRFVCEQPPHACINEIVVSPTWNRLYLEPMAPPLGGD